MAGRGRNGRGHGGRLAVAALAAAPVAVAIAVAVMAATHNPAYDIPPGRLLSCDQNYPPPYPGHEEEVRAIVARGGGPGPISSLDEYVEYFLDNSRETPDLALRSVGYAMKRAADGGEDNRAVTGPRDSYSASPPHREPWDDKMLMMKAVTVINRYEAPPGPCVWEHEYIAWGGSLLDLEYDEGRRCYLAGNGTDAEPASCGLPDEVTAGAYTISCFAKEPAPYELADEETKALVKRAGPAPSGSVLEYAAYLSPSRFSMTGPAPSGSVLEYVVQNTRLGLAQEPNIAAAFALNHTGGDAYRAVKMLNKEMAPRGEGCIKESFWVGWGNRLTDLGYSEEHRCYLAPPEVRAKPLGTPCFP